jgi:tetratricopeptide (TPR) repeat protein
MNTATNMNCLTYEQLQSYSLNRNEKEERAQLYQHISTCELCTCAVNGFAAIPFTLSDVDAICHQIDLNTKVVHASPLTLPQVFLAVFSLASVFGFYYFADSFSEKRTGIVRSEHVKQVVAEFPKTEQVYTPAEINVQPENTREVHEAVEDKKIVDKIIVPMEPIKSITPDLSPVADKINDVNVEPNFNADVIYIYDLKVTNYNFFYFNSGIRSFEIKGHTPSYKENKESVTNIPEKDFEEIIAADKVLKSALTYFSKGKYNKALVEFELLLENNPQDVNSLFYSAVSYYQIGKYDRTIKNLEAILGDQNNVFHPEAKWNLAMSHLKTGEKVKAKELFTEIAAGKGFYSKRATEKLKGL